jgi:iron complex transport system permease protein
MSSSSNIFLRRYIALAVLATILFILIPLASSIGLYRVTFLDIYKMLLGYNLPEDEFIALWIRLRRIFVGAIVGALLGGAGAIAQAVFRNPLASPFTLGISQAAALGVAIALIAGYGGTVTQWFIQFARPYILPIAAFTLAIIQTVLILLLAYRAGLTPQALVLSSIALSFLYQAILAVLQYLVLNELQIAAIVFWMFGDLGKAGNTELLILATTFIPVTLAYMLMNLDLDLIAIGDEIAYTSGLNPKKFRFFATAIAALGTALATCFVGVLAFLGLLAPHIARAIVGSSHRYLLPASMMISSILLIVADTFGRTALSPRTIPAGIVLSFLGAPLLIVLLLRGSRRW